MPLPLPDLDDKTFESLVAESTKLIPRQAPEWTNHNRHDPGITLIELFAWLAEMQQYYLNRIGERNYLKFLKLLGASPQPAAPALGQVTFWLDAAAPDCPAGAVIPAGTPLSTEKGLVFETLAPLRVAQGVELRQILTLGPAGAQNNTDANAIDGLSYFLFGEAAQAGTALYLGFSQALPAGERMDLTFILSETYPVARGSHGDELPEITPSAAVAWEYRAVEGWKPLPVHDDTVALSQSGQVNFDGPADMAQRIVHPVTEALYWLRARLTQGGYELPPKADGILLNTVKVIQRDTLSRVFSFASDGLPDQSMTAAAYLALAGARLLQVREGVLWRDWEKVDNFAASGPNDLHYTATSDLAAGQLTIGFGDGEHGAIPAAGADTIRLICYRPDLAPQFQLGPSNGLPGQTFNLGAGVPIAAGGLSLQVRRSLKLEALTHAAKDISCLLSFERLIEAAPQPDRPFVATLRIRAAQALVAIDIAEALHGDLDLAPDQSATFHQEGLQAGQMVEFTYSFRPGARGGSIDGSIALTTEFGSPPILEMAPRSVVEVQPPGVVAAAWQDWLPLADLDSSGPADPYYLLDEETGQVRFGDGINGDIPPVPADGQKNIRIVEYATSAAEKGNVQAGAICRLAAPGTDGNNLPALTVANRQPTTGGRARETIAQAQTRARAALQTADRAVTAADFEALARATPGLRVARARAIPLFHRGLANYPAQQAPAAVTVVVAPYSTSPQPRPSQGFLDTVCRHLDRHRLLTTQLYVVGPVYVTASVRATVGLLPGAARDEAVGQIVAALAAFLNPLSGGPTGDGWPFGRPVYRSEVYQCIEAVAGVDCVTRLSLDAAGAGITHDAEGNIYIPPDSLVASGSHRIDLLPPGQRCRPAVRRLLPLDKGGLS